MERVQRKKRKPVHFIADESAHQSDKARRQEQAIQSDEGLRMQRISRSDNLQVLNSTFSQVPIV